MKFTLDKTDGLARRARLEFTRGVVDTPAFMRWVPMARSRR